MLVTWTLAIPIGIYRGAAAATRSPTASLSFLAFFGMSLPSFFLAFLLMYLALRTGLVPGRRHLLGRLRQL